VGYIVPVPSFSLIINWWIIIDNTEPAPGFKLIVDWLAGLLMD